ncbi:unnamed protein product [marine sediment metagenome]|uniref:Uncharacterized protein n=1 Tax=marine sediment metagenome TaxID=412755 RepID=X0S8H1_9ZZZZ
MAKDLTQEEVNRGVEAAGRIGAKAGSEALKAQGVIKKKKKPGLVENVKKMYGLGKQLYGKYMAGRKKMEETRPTAPTVRKMQPTPPPEEKEPQAAQPKKKKKPRGGVGGVLDVIQERKRRMQEMIED